MSVSVDQSLLAALMVVCLGSFAWGMRRFFTQPTGASTGMRVVTYAGNAQVQDLPNEQTETIRDRAKLALWRGVDRQEY
jgi:hypothetical protein